MNSEPLAKYNALIESGILQPDSGQADVVARLNSLNEMLKPTSFTQIFKKSRHHAGFIFMVMLGVASPC